MTADDMARELRAAGWRPCPLHRWDGRWDKPGDPFGTCYEMPLALAWARRELAQQRERGNVQTPPAGQEEER